jgi:hypothetical protein
VESRNGPQAELRPPSRETNDGNGVVHEWELEYRSAHDLHDRADDEDEGKDGDGREDGLEDEDGDGLEYEDGDGLEDEDSPTEPSSGDESGHERWEQWHDEQKKRSESRVLPMASQVSHKKQRTTAASRSTMSSWRTMESIRKNRSDGSRKRRFGKRKRLRRMYV